MDPTERSPRTGRWSPTVPVGGNRKAGTYRGVGLGLSILYIEDDADSRNVLAFALEEEGYEVTLAETAEEGLDHLVNGSFHMVVSDYTLPGHSGVWTYEQAQQRGLLANTAYLFVTANPEVALPPGVKHCWKPVDIDTILRTIEEGLMAARNAEIERQQKELAEAMSRAPGGEGAAPRIELVLYISSASIASLRAVRNLHAVVSQFEPSQIRFAVVDLSKGYPDEALRDRITFTPTLVKRTPEPPVWVLGSLDNPDIIADLFGAAGVDPKR